MSFKSNDWHRFDGEFNAVPVVYGIFNDSKQVIYVGQTDDLSRRMAEHRADKEHCMHRYAPALVQAEVIAEETTRIRREQALIAEYSPPCNG